MLSSAEDEISSLEGAQAEVALASEPEPEPEPEPEVLGPQADEPDLPAGDEPFPLAEPGEYYIGLWSGIPNYGCPYCGFATLEGSGAVELHILEKIDQRNPRHMKAMELKEG